MTRTEMVSTLLARAKELDLLGVDFARCFTIEQVAADYNGCGPEWMPEEWREVLDRVFSDFAPAFVLHDNKWAHSDGTEEMFTRSNTELAENCRIIADATYPWWHWRRYSRRHQAKLIGNVCQAFGKGAYNEAYFKSTTGAKDARHSATPA